MQLQPVPNFRLEICTSTYKAELARGCQPRSDTIDVLPIDHMNPIRITPYDLRHIMHFIQTVCECAANKEVATSKQQAWLNPLEANWAATAELQAAIITAFTSLPYLSFRISSGLA